MERPITVGIATRNRADALERCVRSLTCIADLIDRVIVVDDASDSPVDANALRAAVAQVPLEVVRQNAHAGMAFARNLIARQARTACLLGLDDDAFLIGDRAVRDALAVLQHDTNVAAIAFAQCDEHGRKRPATQQASAADVPCYVPSFIGFASLIATRRLLEIGGYRDVFMIFGEEREVCLRWLDRGLNVVYLPDALVGHVAATSNRNVCEYVRLVMRNDCLAAVYNDPLPRAVCVMPYKLWSYTRMRTRIPGGDPGGFFWIVRELARHAPRALHERHAVSWRTLREWKRLRTVPLPYRKSGLAA
jgi:GT2 family glycosyltransferase